MLEDLKKRWVWDGANYCRTNAREELPELGGYVPQFPDPFMYFALKHALKSWFSVHVHNVLEIVRQAALRIYFKQQDEILQEQHAPPAMPAPVQKLALLPAALQKVADEWAKKWIQSLQNEMIVHSAILDKVNASAATFVNFAANGRLDSGILARISAEVGKTLGKLAFLRPKVRALRNKFDRQSGSGLTKLNRKKLLPRLSKLKAALLAAVDAEAPPVGEVIPTGASEVIEVLANSHLLSYLAYPDR